MALHPSSSTSGDSPTLKSNELTLAGMVAISLLLFFGSNAIVAWANQFAPTHAWSRNYSVPIATLICLTTTAFIHKRKKNLSSILAISSLLTVAALYLSSFFLDYSFDGLAYHQRAVVALSEGANFITQPVVTGNIFLDNYAKATWLYAASIFSFFKNSSLGASYHFILGIASALYLYRFCRWAGRSRITSALAALLGFYNPITLSQIYTYYNDASLGSLGIILFTSTIIISRDRNKIDYITFFICCILLINIKASGIIWIGCAFLFMGLSAFIQTRSIIDTLKKTIPLFLLISFFSVGIFGYSPYTQNLLQGRHIFFPLAGVDAKDIIIDNAPYGFPVNNRFHNLFLSVFSDSANLYAAGTKEQPKLKIPGTVKSQEIAAFVGPDLRIAGFGPLYSLSLIISLLAFSILKIDWKVATPLLFMLLLSIAFNPHAWWARYTPTMWFFPMIPLIAANNFRHLHYKILASCLAFSMIANLAIITHQWLSYYPEWDKKVRLEAKKIQPFELKIYTGPFATDLEIISLGLKYSKVDQEYYNNNKDRFITLKRGVDYEMQR